MRVVRIRRGRERRQRQRRPQPLPPTTTAVSISSSSTSRRAAPRHPRRTRHGIYQDRGLRAEEGGRGVSGRRRDQRDVRGEAGDERGRGRRRGGGDHLHVDIVRDDRPGGRPARAAQAADDVLEADRAPAFLEAEARWRGRGRGGGGGESGAEPLRVCGAAGGADVGGGGEDVLGGGGVRAVAGGYVVFVAGVFAA